MEDTLTMSNRELTRLKTIQRVLEGRMTWPEAARQLDLSERQIGRLCAGIRQEGPQGIVHGLREAPSNHQLKPGLLDRALDLVRTKYVDFGPTFANEKLLKIHGIRLSTPTLRRGMILDGLYKPRRFAPKHRAWRERRASLGELVQLDGSDHDWFEGRGPRCVLLIFIDDATSKILFGRFVPVEDTLHLMSATRDYLRLWGCPVAFYVDKDSIYKVNRHASIEEELRDDPPITQFTRAMNNLDIQVICANSPQAKGRVERGFRTHQDRLVKELRLAGIFDPDKGNDFLRDVYIPDHNRRCAVEPRCPANAHRPLLKSQDLDPILSWRTPRTVANDFTFRFQNKFFQLAKDQPVRVRPGNEVLVEIRLDGSFHFRFKDQYLNAVQIPKKPYRPAFAGRPANPPLKPRRPWPGIPAPDHPWRSFKIGARTSKTLLKATP
jgi:hypothetical protein